MTDFAIAKKIGKSQFYYLAEGVGFEPTKPLRAPAFETSAIDHYATLPYYDGDYTSITLFG